MTDRTALRTRDDWLIQVYVDCIDELTKYVRRFVGSPEAAEELAHDAFLRVYTAKNFDQDRSPQGYLFTAARNLALSRNACHRVTRTYSIDEPDDIRDEHRSVERDVLAEQEFDTLHAAMTALPEQQQDVVAMYAVGQTYQEIADQLGISKATVCRQMARALESLMEMM